MVSNNYSDIETGELVYEKYTTDKAPGVALGVGFKRVTYDTKKNEAVLELSAKVLKDQYFELINKNTIERVFSEVNTFSPITFNVGNAIDTTRVLSMDCTNNLKLSREPIDYVLALNQIRINEKYQVSDYKQPGKNVGIVIAGKQKSFKERVIFYDKQVNILSDSFLKKEPYHASLVLQHKGILRVETNLTSFAKIRQYAKSTTMLKDILTSTANPNLTIFDKITKRNSDFQLYLELENGEYSGMTFDQIRKRIGDKAIIKECNYDINLIIQFINKARGKGSNNSKLIREYRNLLCEIMPTEGKIITLKNEPINEIRLSLAG
jgi:hypothetical protein